MKLCVDWGKSHHAFFAFFAISCLFLVTTTVKADDASPTLYQHYTSGGVKGGLNATSSAAGVFTLNGKPFTIFGGSFHYFRVVPQYWRQTLLRMRAAGLNSIMMYFPWNIHEPTQGHFDFTSEAINIAHFLEEVKLADMFAIVRIGPYTCGEWEFGGLPGWLLKDPAMKLRTNYKPFTDLAKIYLNHLMAIVNRFTFSKNGGPVIMLQLENEYFGPSIPHSPEYLRFLHDLVVDSGFKELLFTSDPGHEAAKMPIKGIFPKNDVLETANFNTDSDAQLTALSKAQPGKPLFVSEFWPGWFDFWGAKEKHHRYSVEKFDHEMNDILFKHNASVSIYMFIGGTNFGFYNGANDKQSAFESALHVVTSYDYDAPLTESGNYSAKYHKTRELYLKLVSTGRLPKTRLPEVPKVQPVKAYGSVKVERQLPLAEMLKITKHFVLKKAVPMEMLPEPQSLGFILYRVVGKGVKVFEVTEAIFDRSIFLEDGKEGSSVPYGSRFIEGRPGRKASDVTTFDMLVENQGRINYGTHMESERKGINSNITLDDHVVQNVTAYSLDFNSTFLAALPKLYWTTFNSTKLLFSPAMYEAKLKVEGRPEDTFLKMDGWTKGNVFVNGFNLGRYWKVGPTKTMYLPAPLLKTGENTIQVFELHTPGDQLHFADQPILG